MNDWKTPIPLSRLEHPLCSYAMACEICMSRCYTFKNGVSATHFFPDQGKPCVCGEYINSEDPRIEDEIKKLDAYLKEAFRDNPEMLEFLENKKRKIS